MRSNLPSLRCSLNLPEESEDLHGDTGITGQKSSRLNVSFKIAAAHIFASSPFHPVFPVFPVETLAPAFSSHARNINNELSNSLKKQAFCDAARHVTDDLLR
jgi:hypothetical protein